MARDDDQALAELLWGTGDLRARTRREGLSVERIVRAAIALADADGLDAVSMGRVAERLEFTTMALYRHLRNKDDLLVLMVNAALAPPAADPPAEAWRPALERWTMDVLALLRRHPWVVHVPITGPPATPSQLGWLDRGLRALAGTELDEAEKAAVVLLLNGHVFWGARLFAELDRGTPAAGDAAGLIATVVDADHFPALRRALDAGIFADASLEADFRFGLDRILDGVERLLEQRRSRAL